MKPTSKIASFMALSCASLIFSPLSMADALTLESLPKINGIASHEGASTELHVATDKGLYVSRDNGETWSISYPFKLPATLVTETADGSLYAFVLAKGLLRIRGTEMMWTPVNNQFGAQVLTRISARKGDPKQLVALNQFGRIIVSNDGGNRWHRLRGNKPLGDSARRGKALFARYCQSCHGIEGVGETYTIEALTNKNYIMAPPLDDSTHAWHHTDEALVKTILDGSPRTERMKAWKNEGLTEKEARDLVAYIKSLWGKKALACQGPKHMQCM